jgi:catechol 2,3-dioxygenase-like lactoylglutathione lyase family enzyme
MRALHHVGVTVSSIDRALPFYEDTLGLKRLLGPSAVMDNPDLGPAIHVPGAALRVVSFELGNVVLELLEYRHPPSPVDAPVPPHAIGAGHVAFHVDDIWDEVARLRAKGVEFWSEVNVVDEGVLAGWRWIYCADPDGNAVEFVQIDEA